MKYILQTEVIRNQDDSKIGVCQHRLFVACEDDFYDRLDHLLQHRAAEVSNVLCQHVLKDEALCIDCAADLLGLTEDDIETLMFLGLLLEDDMVSPEDLLHLFQSKLQVVTAD